MSSRMKILAQQIKFNRKDQFDLDGPMILASNHPNAFLDAMIYGAYFKRRIHFLARGDVFRKPLAAKILSSIGLIPIYRIAEGYENLDKNKDTFKICLDILNNNGIVLIFSEGYCEQEWKLRPLLKGTGRLAMMAWAEDGPAKNTKILPVGINYDHFEGLNKCIIVNFSDVLNKKDFELTENMPKNLQDFNKLLQSKLEPLVIVDDDTKKYSQKIQSILSLNDEKPNKYLNNIVSFIGKVFFMPIYYPLQRIAYKKAYGTIFYDSVLQASIMFIYPIYFLLLILAFMAMLLLISNSYIVYIFLGPLINFINLCIISYVRSGDLNKKIKS
jgi:1-acyl-sn-glycerol-3-phosphate acyltransferase